MRVVHRLIVSLFVFLTLNANATDTYNQLNNQLSIPAVILGDTVYRDVVITVGEVLTVGGTSSDPKYLTKPSSTHDTYDPITNRLTIPNVNAFGVIYHDVVITVDKVVTVGTVTYISPNLINTVFDKISSYKNAKNITFYSDKFPVDIWGHTPQLAEARAFFKYGDGTYGLIANEHMYQTQNHTLQQAQPGLVNFYVMKDTEWIKAEIKINYKAETCIHARKIVSADFNNDNVIDFAFMCQGYDATPFPGEKMKILMSISPAEYDFKILHDDVDFYHGGASEDFNGDGLPDLFVGTMNSPKLYLNMGGGKFKYEKTFNQIKRAFSIELVDINRDGKFDIVSGAHEWETPTTIYYNKGDNYFDPSGGITIPGISGAGNILDFILSKNDNCLYIMRTGGELGNRAIWYKGVFIQKFCNGNSEVIYENKDWVDPTRKKYIFTSMRWMIESEGALLSDWGGFLRIPLK